MAHEEFDKLFGHLSVAVTMADPHLPDCPLVAVNDGFVDLTGYRREDAVGRNCRFLQGPGTHPEAVGLLREAVDERKSISICITNYRANGEPFDNFLCITTLRTGGAEPYLVGLQCEIKAHEWKSDVEKQVAMLSDISVLIHDGKNGRSKLDRFQIEARSAIAAARSYYVIKESERLIQRAGVLANKERSSKPTTPKV